MRQHAGILARLALGVALLWPHPEAAEVAAALRGPYAVQRRLAPLFGSSMTPSLDALGRAARPQGTAPATAPENDAPPTAAPQHR